MRNKAGNYSFLLSFFLSKNSMPLHFLMSDEEWGSKDEGIF